MSGNPGQYKDFNKTANDLLTKVFPKKTGQNTWGIETELRPTRYVTSTAKIVNVGGVSTGEVGADVTFSDFGVLFKGLFRTDRPTLEASWKVSDKIPVDGVSAKLHFDATDKSQTAGVSVAYEHAWTTFNARVFVPITTAVVDFAKDIAKQDTRIEGDLVVRHPDHPFVLGALAKVSLPAVGDRRVDEASVSLGYRDGKLFAPTATYTQKAVEGKEDARSLAVVVASQPADTQYAAQVDYELGTKRTVATIGLSYPLNDGAVLKAKLNTNKEAGIGYTNQISASTKIDFGTLFTVNTDKNVVVDSAFSVNVRFTQ